MTVNVVSVVTELVTDLPRFETEYAAIGAATDVPGKVKAAEVLFNDVFQAVMGVISGTKSAGPKAGELKAINPAILAKILAMIQAILAIFGGTGA